MAIKDFYPAIRPALDLNFAGSGIVDPRITFSRSGTGNVAGYFDEKGVMKFAPPNVPRIDFDPVTGECKGLLIEEQRTNLRTYSEQFDNAVWEKTNATITANATVSPSGVLTADKLVETATTGEHNLGFLFSVTSGVSYTFSLFAKAGERSKLRILFSSSGFGTNTQDLFDLSTGTVDDNQSGGASIVSVGNGWYRVVVTTTATATASSAFQIHVCNTTGATNYTGDGTSGIYIWGAQLEQGAFPTSYIPTTSAQVTRAFDSASMTGANFSSWYKPDEGTLFAEYILGADNSSLGVLYIYDGVTSNNSILMRYSSGAIAQYTVNSNGFNQASITASGYSAPGRYKRAVVYAKDSFQQGINGVLQSSDDTSGEVPLVTALVIGAESTAGSNLINGHICRIAYYPKRLNNTNLQALTA